MQASSVRLLVVTTLKTSHIF